MEFIQTIGKLIVRYHSFFEEGIVNTLIIAAFTVFFGTIFGTLMSSMRMSKILPLKWLAVAYIEFIRGTPLMVLRTSHGRLHAAGHFVDPELFAFFRRYHCHEHQQLRLRR